MSQVALVTGVGGFLGSHIANHLVDANFKVVGTGRLHEKSPPFLNPSIALVDSVIPSDSFPKLLERYQPSVVVHAAGSASIDASLREPYQDFKTSTDMTAFIIEAIRKVCPRTHFILLSSAAVYGAPTILPIKEAHAESPISPYGFHKLMAELCVREAHQLFGLQSTIFRIFSGYGERIKRQVLFDLCSKLMVPNSSQVTLFGTGEETRDFIHSQDIARAIEFAFVKKAFGVFNLATGKATSIGDLAQMIREQLGVQKTIAFNGVISPGMPRFWQADISRVSSLGFKPEIALSEGIKRFCAWYKSSLQSHQ